MGDLPFYVGIDSADVWASRQNFLLDKKGHPRFIAGVPPDYFSATGQRWGNPIYDWEYMRQDKFQFWIERLSYTERLFDQVRVDHFRAFDTYWKIKASCPTALDGEWVEAPGYELFDELFAKEPELQIVAEDLGDLRAEVLELRDHYSFRGMRVIQFSFDPKGMEEDKTHLLVYTGTHDNAPIYGWYREKTRKERRDMRRYLWKHGYHKHSFSWDIIDYSLRSKADMVIIPMSDWLHLGSDARLNLPGTVGAPNWMWRINDLSKFAYAIPEIRSSLEESHRTAKKD
jgi:4-alpha-glucanotransferase